MGTNSGIDMERQQVIATLRHSVALGVAIALREHLPGKHNQKDHGTPGVGSKYETAGQAQKGDHVTTALSFGGSTYNVSGTVLGPASSSVGKKAGLVLTRFSLGGKSYDLERNPLTLTFQGRAGSALPAGQPTPVAKTAIAAKPTTPTTPTAVSVAPAQPAAKAPVPTPAPKAPADAKASFEALVTAGKDWQGQLSKAESTAVRNYSNNTFRAQNSYLRDKSRYKPPPPPEKLEASAALLDSAIAKSALPFPLVTYRAVSSKLFPPPLSKHVGKQFVEDGFSSTSVAFQVAKNFTGGGVRPIMEVTLPKKAKAAYIEGITRSKGEHEVLLGRGSKFKATEIVMRDGRPVIRVLLLA